MRKIILDIETKNTFRDVGSSDPRMLDISLLVAYDSHTDTYYSYLEDELTGLWRLLEAADIVIGYNSDHFDLPLLNKYYPGNISRIKSLDILKEIEKSIGKKVRLDSVADATLGKKKSGNGLEAIEWWKNGEIEKIRRYCEDDVRITKEIYEYALKNKHLKYRDIEGAHSFSVDTSLWEKKEETSVNFTLPF
ncbi:MAG: ribonuclease H-like domain-containing protein [Candidatus Moraniibacteriota bacterium]|nr:MAG: ribonuclease H-like domain-containing protein [Candidatus Moranbacteria bacterium]